MMAARALLTRSPGAPPVTCWWLGRSTHPHAERGGGTAAGIALARRARAAAGGGAGGGWRQHRRLRRHRGGGRAACRPARDPWPGGGDQPWRAGSHGTDHLRAARRHLAARRRGCRDAQGARVAGFTPPLSGPDRVRWGTSFHNWIKTWYAPLLFRPQLFLRGVRLLFGDHA